MILIVCPDSRYTGSMEKVSTLDLTPQYKPKVVSPKKTGLSCSFSLISNIIDPNPNPPSYGIKFHTCLQYAYNQSGPARLITDRSSNSSPSTPYHLSLPSNWSILTSTHSTPSHRSPAQHTHSPNRPFLPSQPITPLPKQG